MESETKRHPYVAKLLLESDEPLAVRVDMNAVSKMIAYQWSRLIQTGRIRDFPRCRPLALYAVLLHHLQLPESATLFSQTQRIFVWPSFYWLQLRVGGSRRSVEKAAKWLERERLIERHCRAGGNDATLYEILLLSEQDDPHYWGGKAPMERPRKAWPAGILPPTPTLTNRPSTPVTSDRGTPVTSDRGTPVINDASTPVVSDAPTLMSLALSTKHLQLQPQSEEEEADGWVGQIHTLGIPLTLARRLLAREFNTPERIKAAIAAARAKRPNNDPRFAGLLVHFLADPENFHFIQPDPAAVAAREAARAEQERHGKATLAAKLAWETRRNAQRIGDLHRAGKLAELVKRAVDEAPTQIQRASWAKVNGHDPVAVAGKALLGLTVIALADSAGIAPSPPPPPG